MRSVINDVGSLNDLIKKLYKILRSQNLKLRKTSLSLNGGGIEGFLYELGVSLALNKSFKKQDSLQNFDLISGISSGAIVGSLLACGLKIEDIILAIYGRSKKFPKIGSSLVYDAAAMDWIKGLFSDPLLLLSFNPKKCH